MKMRSTLMGLVLAFGTLLLTGSVSQTAFAQDCNCTPPTPPTPPCNTCGGGGGHHGGHGGGRGNVNVNVSNVNIAISGAKAGASASATSGANISYGGGGYGGGYSPPMATGVIQGLNVEAGGVTRTAYEATRTRMKRVVIQAVCLDDRTIPHPASQVGPDRAIEDAFDGEIYRCIAGTWLQATIADYNGQVDFTGGQTLTCHKNDALYHAPGGKVECRPQRPARDCSERSLLRRFGAGIKILTMVVTERYTAYREEDTRTQTTVAGGMSLDGGVGGIVY